MIKIWFKIVPQIQKDLVHILLENECQFDIDPRHNLIVIYDITSFYKEDEYYYLKVGLPILENKRNFKFQEHNIKEFTIHFN